MDSNGAEGRFRTSRFLSELIVGSVVCLDEPLVARKATFLDPDAEEATSAEAFTFRFISISWNFSRNAEGIAE
jgi:hypothetical protein